MKAYALLLHSSIHLLLKKQKQHNTGDYSLHLYAFQLSFFLRMTKEKPFVVDLPSFSLYSSLPLPVCDIHQKVFIERHALCMHMFEIWKNLGTCISIYAVYPKPLLNHQTLILPITSVSEISNSTSEF